VCFKNHVEGGAYFQRHSCRVTGNLIKHLLPRYLI
jgi:hypothetical protein